MARAPRPPPVSCCCSATGSAVRWTRTTLAGHLEGIAAIMESHFRYEQRRLLTVLEGLDLDADPEEALGTL